MRRYPHRNEEEKSTSFSTLAHGGADEMGETYDNGDVDIVAVPAALLCSLKGSSGIQTMVALGADTQASNVRGGVWCGRGNG